MTQPTVQPTTPRPQPTPLKSPEAPGAPKKPRPDKPDVVPGSCGVMNVEDAKRLTAEDFGMAFGKVMTEEEFLEYRRAKPTVKILKR